MGKNSRALTLLITVLFGLTAGVYYGNYVSRKTSSTESGGYDMAGPGKKPAIVYKSGQYYDEDGDVQPDPNASNTDRGLQSIKIALHGKYSVADSKNPSFDYNKGKSKADGREFGVDQQTPSRKVTELTAAEKRRIAAGEKKPAASTGGELPEKKEKEATPEEKAAEKAWLDKIKKDSEQRMPEPWEKTYYDKTVRDIVPNPNYDPKAKKPGTK